MLASKEAARNANAIMFDLGFDTDPNNKVRCERIKFVREFLDAAEKALPNEATLTTDWKRPLVGDKHGTT